jgi:membrane protease YdiL (CAAX protease family)
MSKEYFKPTAPSNSASTALSSNKLTAAAKVFSFIETFGMFFVFIFLGLAAIISITLIIKYLGIGNVNELNKTIGFNFLMLLISDIIMVGSATVYLLLRKINIIETFKIKKVGKKILLVIPVFFMYVSCLIIAFVIASFAKFIDLDQAQQLPFLKATSLAEKSWSFIALVIIAPITEELFFRGFLFSRLKVSVGAVAAIILSSLMFALAHGQANVGIDTFILGVFSCILVLMTKSIWPSIVLHMMKNGMAFLLIFIFNVK